MLNLTKKAGLSRLISLSLSVSLILSLGVPALASDSSPDFIESIETIESVDLPLDEDITLMPEVLFTPPDPGDNTSSPGSEPLPPEKEDLPPLEEDETPPKEEEDSPSVVDSGEPPTGETVPTDYTPLIYVVIFGVGMCFGGVVGVELFRRL